jgi:DNA phosphorothioation-dependent restriction protein DptH
VYRRTDVLNRIVSEGVARRIARAFDNAGPGHCVRVDHLEAADARSLCRWLREHETKSGSRDLQSYVLAQRGSDELSISSEAAVELRNKKSSHVCLLVPREFVDSRESSLGNAFASFDVTGALVGVAADLHSELPADLGAPVTQVRAQLRGRLAASAESWSDYVASIVEDPQIISVGRELWRIGLLPDCGEDGLVERLPSNRNAVLALTQPARAHASVADRLASIGLRRGAVHDLVLTMLATKELRDSRLWLAEFATPESCGHVTFERWTFETAETDLEAIELERFLQPDGQVVPGLGLRLASGPGSQLIADVGPRQKLFVKWLSHPKSPSNLARWQVQIVPSREEYTEEERAGIDLPSVRVATKARRAAIPLDIDIGELPVRAAQVRVAALDSYGAELRGSEGGIIEAYSPEFWLDEAVGGLGTEQVGRTTAPNLPVARLREAVLTRESVIDQTSGDWIEKDLHYYTVTFNGRRAARLGLSPVLRRFEEVALGNPESVRWRAVQTVAGASIDPGSILGEPLPPDNSEVATFVQKRRDLFRAIQRQHPSALIETVTWEHELVRRARSYAAAYSDLLLSPDASVATAALHVDLCEVRLSDPEESPLLLLMPTHPLRLLWLASYAVLLAQWEGQLLALEPGERERAIDQELLSHVGPVNLPPFVVTEAGERFVFSQNLMFFWGLALPAGTRDPNKRVRELSRALGVPGDDFAKDDAAAVGLTRELRRYLAVHPYASAMRLQVINGGTGRVVSDALRPLLRTEDSEDGLDHLGPPIARVELIILGESPQPSSLPPLERMQREVYEAQPAGRRQHLSPIVALAVRSSESATTPPGGDVHVSALLDMRAAAVVATEDVPETDSASFFGLITRLVATFKTGEGAARWTYSIQLLEGSAREKHPVQPSLTAELVGVQRQFLRTFSERVLAGAGSPAAVLELTARDLVFIDRIHLVSDWVITLDRFFGAELYDYPGDANLANFGRKYLLAYSPEFLDGLGRRVLVTTTHRQEVEEILKTAMHELGFAVVDESVGEVLEELKGISGGLALQTIGDEAHAREAVSLGVVCAYLRSRGQLTDAILIPVDSHPELFGSRRPAGGDGPKLRCDLIRVQVQRSRLVATFIEVKSRGASPGDELLHRIADQLTSTEEVFRDLFFRDPPRVDRSLQRSRLASILRFYLGRAHRHGWVSTDDRLAELDELLGRVEVAMNDLRTERWGFVVNLPGPPQSTVKLADCTIQFLTAKDFIETGIPVTDELSATLHASSDTGASPSGRESSGGSQGAPTSADAVITPLDKGRPANEPSDTRPAARSQATRIIPEADVPAGPDQSTDDAGAVSVELGRGAIDPQPVTWEPSVRGSPHVFVLGIPGQGKSVTVRRIVRELAVRHLPSLVIDFHGQFTPEHGATARVLDASAGLPFSPFEAESARDAGVGYWQTNSFAVAEIFQYVCELGDIQRDVVYEALRESYETLGFGAGSSTRPPSVTEVRDRIAAVEQARGVKNVLPRCRPLLEFGLFLEDTPTGAFEQEVKRGVVIDLHSLGLETLQLAASAFVLRKVYKDMFRWGETKSLRLALVLDEAHRLSRDITLPKLMKEGRKFGIVVVVASQGLADYHPDVVANAGTKVVFRTNYPTSKRVAGFLRARKGFDLSAELEQLEIAEAYVQTPEMSLARKTRMHM